MSSHENSASLRRRFHNEEGEDVKSETTFSNSSSSASTKVGVLRWSEKRVWTFALAFRAANALLVQTYFNPDEHWQSLEVAHRIVFGYGHLTWEWKEGIRSYLHPLLFALLYKILAFLHLDKPLFMAKAPRLFQSLFASIGDLYMYKLSKMIFDEQVAKWALFSQFTNWFMFFCITRTFSNSLETMLTLMGIFYWFSSNSSSKKFSISSRMLGLFIAALTCAVRPTSAITWQYIGLLDLFKMQSRFHFLLFEVLPIGSLVLALSSLLDWWMYDSFVLVPLNFLKFNFLSSGGDYYGTHPWHWYFTQGFPSMLLTFLPYSLIGIFRSKERRISGLIAWVLGVYSFLGHKEFRFVLPVLPIALMFSGYCLAVIAKPDRSGTESKKFKPATKCPSNVQLAVLFLLVTNVPMALYMSLIHQRGSEDVMIHLSKEASKQGVKSVLFLMPCHSTPYYSTLHHDLPMQFLDCTPSSNRTTLAESDFFLMDPHAFALSMFKNSTIFPSHIVLFSSEEPYLRELLISYSFTEVRRFFHAHFKVDRDLQASVVVYSQAIS
ncbi:mannosyltransferase APTG1 [Zingiber officinale]|uniref:mannosyltransferase APTG1 n=1 Tax=Zingiber officinale TaxID=94328 RepID=UPI001C4BAF90|nr:mannosyltransferase APTG1 [Zingiber officinale]XP_042472702.1 mannosyltransferase APTG1 [Zingiber officinale]XP_042472703.1 mannosyltransferase APTG1 [Zingiber officinale]XP_042472704.1 mannosyltransferase APTG1 [Zingiber officinale]XP_042472705.1 mannosyltransferase APTG1 [Zingiber officinale]